MAIVCLGLSRACVGADDHTGSTVGDLGIDEAILEFADEKYCANCEYCTAIESSELLNGGESAFCDLWEMPTRVESGMICPEYLPQGFE